MDFPTPHLDFPSPAESPIAPAASSGASLVSSEASTEAGLSALEGPGESGASASRLEALLRDPLLQTPSTVAASALRPPSALLTRTPLLFGEEVEASPTIDGIRRQVDALAALADAGPDTPAASEAARAALPQAPPAAPTEAPTEAPPAVTDAPTNLPAAAEPAAPTAAPAETAGDGAATPAAPPPQPSGQRFDFFSAGPVQANTTAEEAPLPRLTPEQPPPQAPTDAADVAAPAPALATDAQAQLEAEAQAQVEVDAVLAAAEAAAQLRKTPQAIERTFARVATSPAAAALAESAAILAEDFDERSREVRRDIKELRTSLAGVHAAPRSPAAVRLSHVPPAAASAAGEELADLVRELGNKYGSSIPSPQERAYAVPPEARVGTSGRPSVPPVPDALDRMLRDAGFAGTGARLGEGEIDTDAARAVRCAFVEVLGQYDRRGKLVEELLASAELARSKEADMERMLRRLQTERDETARALIEAERRIAAARDAGAAEGAVSGEKLRQTTKDKRRLSQRCVQLEHSVRSLERDNQSMRSRLAERVKEEEKHRQKGLATVAKLRHGVASPAGKSPVRVHTTGPVSAAEVAAVYERERETAVSELDTLRAENRRISEELVAARQEILRKDGNGGWRTPDAGVLLEKASRAESNAVEARRRATEAENVASETIKAAESQRFAAERKAEGLAEELASLTLELDARPSQKELRSAKRAVELLERKLNAISTRYPDLVSELEEELAIKLDGGGNHRVWAEETSASEEAFENAIGSSAFGRMALTDRERMRRDREVHNRGLKRLERLPRDALAGALQDACLAIGCQGDLASLQEGLAVVKRANAAIPRLESFVREVCAIVLRDGADLVSEPGAAALAGGAGDPAAGASPELAGEAGRVPRLLRAWLTSLRELARHRGFAAHVRGTLADRSSAAESPSLEAAPSAAAIPKHGEVMYTAGGGAPDLAAMASAVRDLVESERALLLTRQNLAGAEEALHFVMGGGDAAPAPLERGAAVALASVAAQAHRLFGNSGGKGPGGPEPTVEGLIPLMNRAYLAHSEARNALKNISAALGCTQACGLSELTARVKDLVAACGTELFRADPAPADRHFANLANLPRDPNRELLDDYRDVVRKPRQAERAAALEAKGVRVDVGEAGNFERNAYARACRSAMQMYAVERPAQLIEAVRAHLAETTKVRSALSQHQKVAGEMCEILKCSSKEELPSSVRELIRRVREAIGEPPVGEVVVED